MGYAGIGHLRYATPSQSLQCAKGAFLVRDNVCLAHEPLAHNHLDNLPKNSYF